MKRYYLIFILISFIVGCYEKEENLVPGFKDQINFTIYDYVKSDTLKDKFSMFLEMLNRSNVGKYLTAYNPNGNGYTLFLPTNAAIENFLSNNSKFKNFQELLNDIEYLTVLCKFHIVNTAFKSDEFPYGALSDYTLTEDLLTINYVFENGNAFYKVNNQAKILKLNIEASNGYIHIIDNLLTPVIYTTYEFLKESNGFSIFKAAVDTTGFDKVLNLNLKTDYYKMPITLLVEHDSIFRKYNVNNIVDLINLISPNNSNFKDPLNPLYNFVGYHIIDGNYFLENFVNKATNYSTYSEIPLLIDGTGLDIKINKGQEIFDIIVKGEDTTIIDYVGVLYDESNVLSNSGSIHFINRILKQKLPTRAIQTYEFYEEPLFNKFRQEIGSHLIEDSTLLRVVKYSGADLIFVKVPENSTNAWSSDYLMIDGDFEISYTIPKIIQGSYKVILNCEAYNSRNAIIQIYIDGKSLGKNINTKTGGSANNPFYAFEVGNVNFVKYQNHVITIKSLIPGRFLWDYIRFEPI